MYCGPVSRRRRSTGTKRQDRKAAPELSDAALLRQAHRDMLVDERNRYYRGDHRILGRATVTIRSSRQALPT